MKIIKTVQKQLNFYHQENNKTDVDRIKENHKQLKRNNKSVLKTHKDLLLVKGIRHNFLAVEI